VLELSDRTRLRLGPDILAQPPDLERMLANLRALPQHLSVGEALQVQRTVAGIGNMWTNEALFEVRIAPQLALAQATDAELHSALAAAARLMRSRLDGEPGGRRVYRRKRRPCPRCGTPIRAFPLGDAARMAYWCPACQRGEAAGAE
jgi:endonuclease VIII